MAAGAPGVWDEEAVEYFLRCGRLARRDGAGIRWWHAANSRRRAREAATSEVHMIEADVLLRGGKGGNGDPIMAHPPETDSDITLQEWLNVIVNTDKGIKLDFKRTRFFKEKTSVPSSAPILTICWGFLNSRIKCASSCTDMNVIFGLSAGFEITICGQKKYHFKLSCERLLLAFSLDAVQPSLELLEHVKLHLRRPVLLNADILPGPNGSNAAVDGKGFLDTVTAVFPNVTLSLGWTTGWHPDEQNKGYDWMMVKEMARICSTLSQPVTFPVRAALVRQSMSELCWLIQQSDRYSLTIWTGKQDVYSVEDLLCIRKNFDKSRVYYDILEPQNSEFKKAIGI